MEKLRIEKPTDFETGLSVLEVTTNEKNVIEEDVSKSYKSIFLEHIFTFFNIVNFALAALVFYTGSYRNMLFMGIVILNTIIGLVQEIKSKHVLDKLALISQQKAEVLRESQIVEIPIDEIVRNDIVIFKTGNQISCDCVVVEGFLEVNESMLTGESISIIKRPGDPLWSGTYVVSGQAKAQVVNVGKETYAYSILKEAKRSKRYPSQLRDSIQTIIKVCTIILIPLGLLLFLKQYLLTRSLNETILSTVAAVIGMIPEGLVFLTSIALAISSRKLAEKKVLVQELYCIETLARVNTLCLDKTGTITQGQMHVVQTIEEPGVTNEELRKVLGNLYHVLPADNATARAIKEYAPFHTIESADYIEPFSSSRKKALAAFGNVTYYAGAYSYIFENPDMRTVMKIDKLSEQGLRVLAVATKNKEEKNPKLIGLVCIEDPLREDAKKILGYFYKQDVDIKIISGDAPETVASIARTAGVKGGSIDMKDVQEKEAIRKAVLTHSVFGRVSPEQKKEMIELLKQDGRVVAMTGDGVNDVMALKQADCSIAMGSGSQAARQIASLVLLDDQFEAMPSILREGRRVINNIQKTASLFLVKTLFSVGLSFLTLFFLANYPFYPIQLTLISSLCTGFPSFVLTLEPNEERVRGNFLEQVFSKAIPGALNVILMVIIVNLCNTIFWHYDQDVLKTICTILAGINALFVLLGVCRPLTLIRKALVLTMAAAFFSAVIIIPDVFLLVELSAQELIWTLIGSAILPFTLWKLEAVSWKKYFHKLRFLTRKKEIN